MAAVYSVTICLSLRYQSVRLCRHELDDIIAKSWVPT